ncbi:MAG: type IV pilus assembly protein PilM [Candidatus Pacebacteria bacterium]|nr:type IV pilus assembly protein PilM [Candidatus Paceibacterota bacterium]
MGLFSSSDETFLGIDIGDSSIKMVELKKKNKKILLSNYGFSENLGVKFGAVESAEDIAKAIMKIKNDVGIKTNRATASLPTFAVFSSVINLYNLDKKALAEAIHEEAKKVIPLPLQEMVLDWKILPDFSEDKSKNNVKVFLTGSPKKLVKKYIDIFNKAKLTLASLETETFSLIRSIMGGDKSSVIIAEIGANSTDISIIHKGIPILNRSIDICGSTVTKALMEKMSVNFSEAEQMKYDLSISSKNGMPEVIAKAVKPIVSEIEYMIDFFNTNYNGGLEKIILSGGASLLFNLAEHIEEVLKIRVIIGDPWAHVYYPPEMRNVLKQLGPKLSVAVGLAMREIK